MLSRSSSNSATSCSRIISRICLISSKSIRLQGYQLAGKGRQQLAACRGDQDIIFDADATEAGQVRTGFNGEHHAGRQADRRSVGAGLGDARLLVDIEAEAVARAVAECLAEPALPQQV